MKKQRVLFCRYTVDGHDRGLITVMNRCRDAGMEVIYIHFHNVKEIIRAAVQEDAQVIAISSSMGEHFSVTNELMPLLKEDGYNIPVIVGGVIPTVDVEPLLKMDIKGVFGPGSSPDEAIDLISKLA